MLDVLLVGKSLKYCMELINELNNNNENIKFVGIVNNVKYLKHELKKKHIDIILIYLNTSQIKNILNLKEINTKITSKSIILILDELNLNTKLKNNKLVYDYILKSDNFENLLNIFNKLVTDRTSILEKSAISEPNKLLEEIKNELNYLRYSFSHIGTKYITESIYILYNSEYYYNYDLEKEVYPIIANTYHKTIHSIKCSIAYATTSMYYNCEEIRLLNYIKENSLTKPGAKKIMCSIIERIKFNNKI